MKLSICLLFSSASADLYFFFLLFLLFCEQQKRDLLQHQQQMRSDGRREHLPHSVAAVQLLSLQHNGSLPPPSTHSTLETPSSLGYSAAFACTSDASSATLPPRRHTWSAIDLPTLQESDNCENGHAVVMTLSSQQLRQQQQQPMRHQSVPQAFPPEFQVPNLLVDPLPEPTPFASTSPLPEALRPSVLTRRGSRVRFMSASDVGEHARGKEEKPLTDAHTGRHQLHHHRAESAPVTDLLSAISVDIAESSSPLADASRFGEGLRMWSAEMLRRRSRIFSMPMTQSSPSHAGNHLRHHSALAGAMSDALSPSDMSTFRVHDVTPTSRCVVVLRELHPKTPLADCG